MPLFLGIFFKKTPPWAGWSTMVAGFVPAAILGLLFVVGRGGLGDGDVRLAPLLGMYLGYLDIVLVPVALLIAAVLGSVVAVIVLMRGGDRRSTIPFGPFLAAGTLAAVLM